MKMEYLRCGPLRCMASASPHPSPSHHHELPACGEITGMDAVVSESSTAWEE